MKTYALIILFILILSATSLSQSADSLKLKLLPPAEFLSAYQNSEKGKLIDVREFFEYRKSRIKDAINIPSSGNLDSAADSIDKNSELFFYCTSGFRSKRVAKFFYGSGFTNVCSLDGGIKAWKKEGMPVVKKKIRKHKD
jgi:rhodanese-related sulfurtransferase